MADSINVFCNTFRNHLSGVGEHGSLSWMKAEKYLQAVHNADLFETYFQRILARNSQCLFYIIHLFQKAALVLRTHFSGVN